MSWIPQPYPNGTHVMVRGTELVITDHAPHADDFRYVGHPAALAGREMRFSHGEASPVPPRGVPYTARTIDPEPADDDLNIVEATPEGNALKALALWAHGRLSSADLKATYQMYAEGLTS